MRTRTSRLRRARWVRTGRRKGAIRSGLNWAEVHTRMVVRPNGSAGMLDLSAVQGVFFLEQPWAAGRVCRYLLTQVRRHGVRSSLLAVSRGGSGTINKARCSVVAMQSTWTGTISETGGVQRPVGRTPEPRVSIAISQKPPANSDGRVPKIEGQLVIACVLLRNTHWAATSPGEARAGSGPSTQAKVRGCEAWDWTCESPGELQAALWLTWGPPSVAIQHRPRHPSYPSELSHDAQYEQPGKRRLGTCPVARVVCCSGDHLSCTHFRRVL
jgi:hypothetical protein